MLRILIIGLGSIAKKHLNALQKFDVDVEIYALRSSKSGGDLAGIINIYNIGELKVNPNFIIISNPTIHHYQTLKEVVNLGCPLFIEKPALHNLTGSEELLEVIEKNNILTYIGCHLRFHDSLIYLKNFLSSSKEIVNEVNLYCGSYLPEWRAGVDYRKVYSSNIDQGGGVHLDLIHELDYSYWLFGTPLNIHSIRRSRSTLNISAIDYANYTLEYDHFVTNIILNYYRRETKRTCEVVFENDTWVIDLLKNSIYSEKKGLIFSSSQTVFDIYVKQMEYFLNYIKGKAEGINTFKDGIDVLKVCLHNSNH